MGLCKCPKRQVTNQFCFEHRVNVCENCMVQTHSKCIVQSYLQWLKDSDFNAFCLLCNQSLESEECVRLICYHVFHWSCLNSLQQSMPANTAPNGRICPQSNCGEPIFPPQNLVSPIADQLRTRLSQVNWGRNEMGLPLLAEERIVQGANFNQFASVEKTKAFADGGTQSRSLMHTTHGIASEQLRSESPHSVVNMDYADYHGNSRRPLLTREPPLGSSDRDDNKYKKRTPSEIFSRWSRQFYAPASKPPWRRKWFLAVAGIAVFVFIIYIMSILGRRATTDDAMLDMNMNPMLQHEE